MQAQWSRQSTNREQGTGCEGCTCSRATRCRQGTHTSLEGKPAREHLDIQHMDRRKWAVSTLSRMS